MEGAPSRHAINTILYRSDHRPRAHMTTAPSPTRCAEESRLTTGHRPQAERSRSGAIISSHQIPPHAKLFEQTNNPCLAAECTLRAMRESMKHAPRLPNIHYCHGLSIPVYVHLPSPFSLRPNRACFSTLPGLATHRPEISYQAPITPLDSVSR